MVNFYTMKMICGKDGEQSPEAIKRFIDQCGVIGIGAPEETTGAGTFQQNIQIGDIIVLRQPQALLRVLSVPLPYQRDGRFPDFDWLCFIRRVEVISWRDEDVLKYDNIPYFSARGYLQTCAAVDKKEKQNIVIDWLNIIQGTKMKQDLLELLKESKNLILTGAPGTGKTYLAMELADAMTGDSKDTPASKRHSCFVQFHPSYDYADFVEGLRPTKPNEDGNIGFVRQDGAFKAFCKRAIENQTNNFKDAYQALLKELAENYSKEKPLELKTEGMGKTFKVYRNSQNGLGLITGSSCDVQGSLTAEKIESFLTTSPYPYWEGYYRGVLKYLQDNYNLNTSTEPTDQKYVFIIDEINRGDIAKIFGELFFALDPGYRGQKEYCIMTQYSNLIEEGDAFKDGFYIPKNVYIIGTMNDIDRNVESMDFAIRRRFTWKEIKPEDNLGMWDDPEHGITEYKDSALKHMQKINGVITGISGLGPAYQLGASYFLKLREYKGNFESLWNYHIQPLLNEYLRGLPNAKVEMDKLETAWKSALPTPQPTNSEVDTTGNDTQA